MTPASIAASLLASAPLPFDALDASGAPGAPEAPAPGGPFAGHRAKTAYGAAATRTGRQAERQVIEAVTARLGAAEARPGDFARRAQALLDNRRLWTRLAADVADARNGLPAELRARLFWLAEFTEHHSARALRGEAGLGPLIEVNAAVLRGLAGLAEGAARAAPAP